MLFALSCFDGYWVVQADVLLLGAAEFSLHSGMIKRNAPGCVFLYYVLNCPKASNDLILVASDERHLPFLLGSAPTLVGFSPQHQLLIHNGAAEYNGHGVLIQGTPDGTTT